MDLTEKTAIVTGAACGLGTAIAKGLAREGMKLALVDLKKDLLGQAVEEIKSFETEVLAIEADVSSAEDTRKMADETLAAFGGIHVLVNNAGIIIVAQCTDETEENWDKIMNVNLKGAFLCSKAVMPHMIEARNGKIINLSSVAGRKGLPLVTAYSVSKAGVIGLTQALAQGLGEHNITVNAVCPGFIGTSMWSNHIGPALSPLFGVDAEKVVDEFAKANTPLQRAQTPEDIAQAVVYLSKADNVTGICLTVDGGYLCM